METPAKVNHVGLCVADLARSRRFYEELFGFRTERELSPPDEPTAQLLGLDPPLGVRAVYLRLGDFVLELLAYERPGGAAPFRPRTMDEPGLTHLSLGVDDLRATVDRVVELGGSLVPGADLGMAVMIRDPDGQLLEILPSSWSVQ